MKLNVPKATYNQVTYIEQLAIDLELDRKARNANISLHLEKEVKYLDELTRAEATSVIDYFKRLKAQNQEIINDNARKIERNP